MFKLPQDLETLKENRCPAEGYSLVIFDANRGSATHGKGTIHFPSQVSGAAAAAAPAGGAVDDSPPPPDGNGGIPGVIGACNFFAAGWRSRS